MPRVLTDEELDPTTEALDQDLTADDERILREWQSPVGPVADLTDGGTVNGVNIYPTKNGRKEPRGRAAARRVWMWNGTESLIPLAWNPDGTIHDGGRRYLLKRHCLCCQASGFRGPCLACVKKACGNCQGGSDKKFNIPCFYLHKDEVPFPERFYGAVDCFLPLCIRRGKFGFKIEQDMRLHARFRHRMEYQVHIETLESQKASELEVVQRRLDALMATIGQGIPRVEQAATERKAPQRRPKAKKPNLGRVHTEMESHPVERPA